MAIAQIVVCFIFWLVLAPFCVGILPTFFLEKRPRHLGTTYMLGWVLTCAVFQLIAVPFIIKGYFLSDLVRSFMICMGILSISGLIVQIVDIGNGVSDRWIELPSFKKMSRADIVTWIIFGVLMIFQMVMSYIYMTPDGDDAYYITHAQISTQLETMYRMDAYTGIIGAPDYRHALAPFPMFIAFLSKRSSLHAAIVAHSVLPLFLIPLSYLAYYKVASLLFEDNREKIGPFMVIIAAVSMFGGASFYTKETFFLTRIWQGKSLVISFMIPVVTYLLLLLAKHSGKQYVSKRRIFGIYFVMFIANIACALMSSLGLFLVLMYTFVMMVVISIRNKKLWIVLTGLITMIPGFIFMGLYVFM